MEKLFAKLEAILGQLKLSESLTILTELQLTIQRELDWRNNASISR